jgi:hypothetical protein
MGLLERERGVGANELLARSDMGERRGHRHDRIDRRGGVGPGRQSVGGVDRRIDLRAEAGNEVRADMAAGRKTNREDAGRVDAEFAGAVTDQADGALGVGQGNVGAGRPALARKAVEEDEDGDALRGEQARELIALLVEHHPAIAAAGRDQGGGAVGLLGPEDRHARTSDAEDVAVIIGGIVAALGHRLDRQRRRRAGSAARPELDRLDRVGKDQSASGGVHGGRRQLRAGPGGKAAGEGAEQGLAAVEPHASAS